MSSALPAVSPYPRRRGKDFRPLGHRARRAPSPGAGGPRPNTFRRPWNWRGGTTHRRFPQQALAPEAEGCATDAPSRSHIDVRRPGPLGALAPDPWRSLPANHREDGGMLVLIRRTCLWGMALRPEAASRRAPAQSGLSRVGTIIIRLFIYRRKRPLSQETGLTAAQRSLPEAPCNRRNATAHTDLAKTRHTDSFCGFGIRGKTAEVGRGWALLQGGFGIRMTPSAGSCRYSFFGFGMIPNPQKEWPHTESAE